MSDTTVSTTEPYVERVSPVEYGLANYFLFTVSGFVVIAFIVGVVMVIRKECLRSRQIRQMNWRRKLNVRRKAISGSALRRDISNGSLCVSEETSYIQLTETPTSLRSTSAWTTPSPDSKNNFTLESFQPCTISV